uniref:Cullin-4 n=1 Tax=Syphacia muris TaxID=451379 RepID=A0A0N5A7K2_9BILA
MSSLPKSVSRISDPQPSQTTRKRIGREAPSLLIVDSKNGQDSQVGEAKRSRVSCKAGTANTVDSTAKIVRSSNFSTPTSSTASAFTNLGGRSPYTPLSGEHSPLVSGKSSCKSGQKTHGVTGVSGDKNAKKLIIRNFKQRTATTAKESVFESSWHLLEEAVIAIQTKQKAHTTFEQLYHTVENWCNFGCATEMYEKLRECILNHVKSELTGLTEHFDATILFLQHLNSMWLEHCEQMVMIRSVFLFLDRTFVLQTASLLSLWDLGLEIFRDTVIVCDAVRSRTTIGLLKMIETEREGSQVDRQLLKSLLRMLMNLGVYQQIFEKPFLKATATLYEAEGRNLCQELEVPAYLAHVKKRLDEEVNRVDYYLDFATSKPLILSTEKYFIVDHMEQFINKGFDVMLMDNRYDELKLMFSLLKRADNGLVLLRTAFSAYIKKVGKALVMDTDREKALVADLLKMKKNLDYVIEECFESYEKFVQAEKDAFDYFINTRPNKPAELVAKFMDAKLRAGNKEATDEELENLMDDVILIFRFIQGKDVFEAFYKKDLAKRLLLGRSASVDAEKSMLSKLKHECGAGFTTKLEGMFKDIELSKDLVVAFKQYMEHGGPDRKMKHSPGNIDFSVSVLTMGHWPSYEYMEVNIPPDLAEYEEMFKQFYFSKHNGRKLQWQHSLGQFLLRARFKPTVVKELQVTMFQTLVLLLFNDKLEWSYEEIKNATKIDKGDLDRTLQSLACGRLRVILKSPRGKDIGANDVFKFNSEFNDKLYRIRINQVQMKETAEEHSQTEEQIFQDRQYQIDAAIVRIMKMRKTLSHALLMTELFNQLRFHAKPIDLKKRIESLIEREYMCRDAEDSNIYKYVA